jgi:hypothetical protein
MHFLSYECPDATNRTHSSISSVEMGQQKLSGGGESARAEGEGEVRAVVPASTLLLLVLLLLLLLLLVLVLSVSTTGMFANLSSRTPSFQTIA